MRRRNGSEVFRNDGHPSRVRSATRSADLQRICGIIIVADINNGNVSSAFYKNHRAVAERLIFRRVCTRTSARKL